MNSEIVQIEGMRKLTEPAYVLSINRGSLNFVPGQYSGNSNMIHEVMDILTDKNIPLERIRTEVYF